MINFHTLALLSTVVVLVTTEVKSSSLRSSKSLGFDSLDIFEELFEDARDPVKKVQSKQKKHVTRRNDNGREEEKKNFRKIGKQQKLIHDEKIALYNPETGQISIVPASEAYLALPPHQRPWPDTPQYYPPQYLPHQHNHNSNYVDNNKIFWGSVGDAIEAAPIFPIQVNVPDMITAMASFFSNAVPFLNRWQNANEPRPLNFVPPPPFSLEDSKDAREVKKHKGTNKKTRQKPREKAVGNRLGGWTHNKDRDDFKYKNMPINSKRVKVYDKELFNFKHSDIYNSPIMILSMSARPMYYYKSQQSESRGSRRQKTKN